MFHLNKYIGAHIIAPCKFSARGLPCGIIDLSHILHETVVGTSVVILHKMGPALRMLAAKQLTRIIQN